MLKQQSQKNGGEMRNRRLSTTGVSLVTIILALSLSLSGMAETAKRLKVFVSILPQAYFVERVGGSLVDVNVLVGPGQSPATYDPTPRQMAELSQADVFFRIGVPFENRLLEKISKTMSHLNVVDTRDGVPLRRMPGDSTKGNYDPHIWLDPHLVKIQSKNM